MKRLVSVRNAVLGLSLLMVGCAPTAVTEEPVHRTTQVPATTSVPSMEESPPPTEGRSYCPPLTPDEAEDGAGSLRATIRDQGRPLEYADVPTLEYSLHSLGWDDMAMRDFAERYECISITLEEWHVHACAHKTDPQLVLVLGEVLIVDNNGNGQLAQDDGVFFYDDEYDESLWFITTEENRTDNPDVAELIDRLYPDAILGAAPGFLPGPDEGLVSDVEPLTCIFVWDERMLEDSVWAIQMIRGGFGWQWADYVADLETRQVPVAVISAIDDATEVNRQSDTACPRYDSYLLISGGKVSMGHAYLTQDGKVKQGLSASALSDVYHEAVHAYWDQVAKDSPGNTMHELVHGIAGELTQRDRICVTANGTAKLGWGKAEFKEQDALYYAEEATAYAVQALVKFYASYYNKSDYIKDKKLTDEGRRTIMSQGWLGKERAAGYFRRSRKDYRLCDIVLTDYALNKAFELTEAGFRIESAEAEIPIYTKTRLFGPSTVTLQHDPTDDCIVNRGAGVRIENFIADATFQNPYSSSEGSWSYGFLFRYSGSTSFLAFQVESDGDWKLSQVTEAGWYTLTSGRLSTDELRTGATESNHLSIAGFGKHARVYVNGRSIGRLGIWWSHEEGDVFVATGMLKGDERSGKATTVKDFTVYTFD